MIAAGVNAKVLSSYMGHANIQITFDKYGHLMPGNESQAAELLDAYLGANGGWSNTGSAFACSHRSSSDTGTSRVPATPALRWRSMAVETA